MGYDLNRFIDIQEIPSHLRCLICSLVLQNPLQSPCEHRFCNGCITIHLQSANHCPHHDEDSVSVKSDKKKSPLRKMSFRKIIGKSPKQDKLPQLKLSDLKTLPESALEELKQLRIHCDYNTNGCDEQLTLFSLNEHIKSCKYVEQRETDSSAIKTTIKTTTTTTTLDQPLNSDSIEPISLPSSDFSSNDRVEQLEQIDETINSALIEEDNMGVRNKRKDSETSKSINGETKLVSEEEVGSDDFVVIPKAGGSLKSTESVQTTSSDAGALLTDGESKENVNKLDNVDNEPDTTATDKKKKKKKKKTAIKSDDALSLGDAASLKGVESGDSKAQSKDSLNVESEELKRLLKDTETKSENLRLINNQLLLQVKQLRDEKEEFSKKLQTQLGSVSGETDVMKNKIEQLENTNRQQALKISQLLNSNENLSKFIISLREDRSKISEQYNATLNNVQQIAKLVKTCKQSV